jgi:hypothetical protein
MSKATIVSLRDLEKARNRSKKKDWRGLASTIGEVGARDMQMYLEFKNLPTFEEIAKQLRRTK